MGSIANTSTLLRINALIKSNFKHETQNSKPYLDTKMLGYYLSCKKFFKKGDVAYIAGRKKPIPP